MKPYKEYRVIEAFDITSFKEYVERSLGHGWVLQGGVSWSKDSGYLQAMAR